MQRVSSREKQMKVTRKKLNSNGRQDTFRVPQKAHSRWSDIITTTVTVIVAAAMTVTDIVIAVTIVITMIADDEEKRSARICFGISFSLKNHLRNRTHAKVALCFSYCHKRSF